MTRRGYARLRCAHLHGRVVVHDQRLLFRKHTEYVVNTDREDGQQATLSPAQLRPGGSHHY